MKKIIFVDFVDGKKKVQILSLEDEKLDSFDVFYELFPEIKGYVEIFSDPYWDQGNIIAHEEAIFKEGEKFQYITPTLYPEINITGPFFVVGPMSNVGFDGYSERYIEELDTTDVEYLAIYIQFLPAVKKGK